MISKKFRCILDVTANTRACCLGNHLGMSQVSLDTLVKFNLWKGTEKCRGCCWCRRPLYGTYMCASCGALMLGGVPSVALTCSGFDIAYSYWCVKGRASWNPSPATWELLGVADAAKILIKHSVTVIWTFRSTEHMLSSKCEKIEPSQYNPAAPPAQVVLQKSAIIFAACMRTVCVRHLELLFEWAPLIQTGADLLFSLLLFWNNMIMHLPSLFGTLHKDGSGAVVVK